MRHGNSGIATARARRIAVVLLLAGGSAALAADGSLEGPASDTRGRVDAVGNGTGERLESLRHARRASFSMEGLVRLRGGTAAAGVFVTARGTGQPHTHTVIADRDGRFRFASLPAGGYDLIAHGPAVDSAEARVTVSPDGAARAQLEVSARAPTLHTLPSSAMLSLLPAGEEKQRFILDCTGCHLLNERVALPQGSPRSRDSWAEAVTRMLGFAGPSSGFPVIAADRDPEATAAFLSRHIAVDAAPSTIEPAEAENATVTEYPIPAPNDLPHDVAVTADGKVAITGMFTHRMYLLDPETGSMETVPIPVQNANPRAVEIDADGNWWVLLGGPGQIARYEPPSGQWKTFTIGMYGHSIALTRDGRAWFNGHFSRNPELIGFVSEASAGATTHEVPAHPAAAVGAGPIPYELRAAPDGRIWGSELIGNRVFVFDPATARFTLYDMPAAVSGPRRLDIGPDGNVWIPLYSAGRLARLDPATGRITEIDLPLADAAPYVTRVDPRTGVVWIGTGAADAILAYDPASRRFRTYHLPTRGAMIRHMAIDPRSGDVWAAYGASPGVPSKVARLRVHAPR